jgi:hypothetical protein
MAITLRDLVAQGVALEWFESVAIVQELAWEVQRAAGSASPRVPELSGAEVTPEGLVRVVEPGSPDQAPVYRLAHVLNALLANDSPPVPLRLIVLTALSPEPSYKSVLELTRALEYFERPNRREVIRTVHERVQALPAMEGEVEPLPGKPAEATAAAGNKRGGRRWRREWLVAGAVLVVATVSIGIGWWTTQPAGARILSGTRTFVSRAIASGLETIRSGLGGGAAVAADVVPPKPVAIGKPVPVRPPRPLPVARSIARNGMAPMVTLAPEVDPETWVGPPEHIDEVIWLAVPAAVAAAAADLGPYSAADADVLPPVAVHPRLPREPPPGVSLDTLTRLELVVSAAGEVDTVKIVSGPRHALDGMMLSAVKTWRFQPATRDGRPVAYRHTLWLTNQ